MAEPLNRGCVAIVSCYCGQQYAVGKDKIIRLSMKDGEPEKLILPTITNPELGEDQFMAPDSKAIN